jgi:hypothetical protein
MAMRAGGYDTLARIIAGKLRLRLVGRLWSTTAAAPTAPATNDGANVTNAA